MFGTQAGLPHGQRARVNKLRAAFKRRDAEAFHVVGVAVAHGFHDCVLVLPGAVEFGAERAADAAFCKVLAGGHQLRGVVPVFFRHAATVQATAAPLGFLDDGNGQAAQGGEYRGAITTRAGADDDEVKLLHGSFRSLN